MYGLVFISRMFYVCVLVLEKKKARLCQKGFLDRVGYVVIYLFAYLLEFFYTNSSLNALHFCCQKMFLLKELFVGFNSMNWYKSYQQKTMALL